ncbi:hypothetical protein [Amycolatopsis sp. NPDC098790]|uniref:hypothetical protein n=1 Tax=Amycolatopsis sp. NPDC098790 TaxID=3363939 RepID=UPI00382C0398
MAGIRGNRVFETFQVGEKIFQGTVHGRILQCVHNGPGTPCYGLRPRRRGQITVLGRISGMSASNTRFAAVVGAANLLVCAAVGTVLLLVHGTEGQTVQSVSAIDPVPPGYESSAPATGIYPNTPARVDEGYETVTAPDGFSTVVPRGWPSEPKNPGSFQATDPADDSHYVRYGATEARGELVGTHVAAEKDTATRLTGLRRVRMDPIDVRGSEAVDWEFTWESLKEGTRHVRAVYWRTGGVEYFVYVSALDSAWQPMPELLGTMVDRSRP